MVSFDPSLKNDPFLEDAFDLPVPLQLVPKTVVPEVAPDFSGFPSIVDYIYEDLVTINKDFRKEVSSACFMYYCTQLLSLRIIAVRLEQGVATYNEENHLRNARKDNNPILGLIDQYLCSIGEFTIENGTHFRVRLPEQGIPDWSRITADNHVNYMCYPFPTDI